MSVSDVILAASETPSIGQRVLVWDKPYKAWVIAYWTRDLQFEEWQNGNMRIINGEWWSPLPAAIEE